MSTIKERHGIAGLNKRSAVPTACTCTVQDGDGVVELNLAGGDWVQFTPEQAMLFAAQIQQSAERVGSRKP